MTTLNDLSQLAQQVGDLYAQRFNTPSDARFALMKLAEENGELMGAWMQRQGESRGTASQQDLEDEVADVLGFLLLFAQREGIDPAQALRRKWGSYLDEPRKDLA
jgi:NTP pyrophosphatase (non-canonical NTP hydrolase)